MLRFLLIIGLIGYVLYKIGSFFFRAGAASQQLRNFEEQQRRTADQSKRSAQKATKKGNVNGGDYIDYEEVK